MSGEGRREVFLIRMNALPETERRVLELRLGIDTPVRSAVEVARELGISAAEVERLEHQALERVKPPKTWFGSRVVRHGIGTGTDGLPVTCLVLEEGGEFWPVELGEGAVWQDGGTASTAAEIVADYPDLVWTAVE